MHPTWTRDEAIAKQKEMGVQRFSLFACMTCARTASNHATWDEDPASCFVRHATPMALSRWGARRTPTAEQRWFADELRAIAMLIEAHREEFDALVESLGEVVDLAAMRGKAPVRKKR
jgi:hypothetical protein